MAPPAMGIILPCCGRTTSIPVVMPVAVLGTITIVAPVGSVVPEAMAEATLEARLEVIVDTIVDTTLGDWHRPDARLETSTWF